MSLTLLAHGYTSAAGLARPFGDGGSSRLDIHCHGNQDNQRGQSDTCLRRQSRGGQPRRSQQVICVQVTQSDGRSMGHVEGAPGPTLLSTNHAKVGQNPRSFVSICESIVRVCVLTDPLQPLGVESDN